MPGRPGRRAAPGPFPLLRTILRGIEGMGLLVLVAVVLAAGACFSRRGSRRPKPLH